VKHKIWMWIAIAFVVFFVVRNPHGAAATAGNIGAGLARVGAAFGDFFTSVTGGGR
jgi:hypothetical protein